MKPNEMKTNSKISVSVSPCRRFAFITEIERERERNLSAHKMLRQVNYFKSIARESFSALIQPQHIHMQP